MKPLLCLTALLAILPALGQEPVERPEASIRIGGKVTDGVITITVDGKKIVLVLVEIGKDQTIYLHTQQKLENRAVQRIQKLSALNVAQSKALLTLAKEKKGDDFKEGLDALRQEFEEKKLAVDWVVVHGVIAKAGPILADVRSILVVGEMHYADAAAKPAPPRPGFTVLEGEIQPGKVELAKEESAPFSIKLGAVFIAVTGKQAMALSEPKGILRVAGRFRINENGVAIIDAETLKVRKE